MVRQVHPNDWIGGCKTGDYEIDLDWGVTSPFAVDASSDSFRCPEN